MPRFGWDSCEWSFRAGLLPGFVGAPSLRWISGGRRPPLVSFGGSPCEWSVRAALRLVLSVLLARPDFGGRRPRLSRLLSRLVSPLCPARVPAFVGIPCEWSIGASLRPGLVGARR
jgi:hypothetical protein